MERDMVRRVQPLARRLRAVADAALASLEISDSTGGALLQILRLGAEARQGSLATVLEMSAPSVVRLVDQLEERGMVVREIDAADRRLNRLQLTDRGLAAAERLESLLAPVREELFSGFSDDDLRIASAVLTTIDERARSMSGDRR